jgi:glycosyltransferase involved in cell wall biosynthesis
MPSSESPSPAAAPWPAHVRRPVKVAFLLQDFTMGGISQWIYTICCELHRTNAGAFEFHFIATHGWVIQERFHRIGTAVFLGRRYKPPNWLVWRRVTAYLRQLRPDIVQFSNLEAYRDVCRRVKPPIVIDRKAGLRTLNRYDLRGVDAVISQNQQLFDALDFDPSRKFLVYHGIDLDAMAAITPNRLGFGPDAFIVGQASRLGGGQNHKLLIDAVMALRLRHPQVKLVLVGGTTPQAGSVDLLPALREYARPLGEHAVLTGAVDEPWELIAGFNAGTSTSTRELREGASRKLVEPMAMGIPCVATDSGATEEVVEDGVNGFVVPDGDLNAMVRRLEQLILDGPLYRRLAAAARRTVAEKFNIRIQADKVRTIYLTLLEEHGRSRESRGRLLAGRLGR